MPSKFDFISPDVVIREIDQSQIPAETADDGALIIGQALQGPAMQPIKVKNLDDLYTVFGRPQSGTGNNSDIWRNGNSKLPTYGLYAAQAWLASETSPVTFMRLAGNDQISGRRTSGYTRAGWSTGHSLSPANQKVNQTAYGLFIIPSGTVGTNTTTQETVSGTLAAVVYAKNCAITLQGDIYGTATTPTTAQATATWTFSDKPNETTTITLTDYEGTSVVFEVDDTGDGASIVGATPVDGGGASGFAAALNTAINSSALKITSTNPSGGTIVLTQDAAGYEGNKTITLSDSANWNANCSTNVPAHFEGGRLNTISRAGVFINSKGVVANSFTLQFWRDGLIDEKTFHFDPTQNGGFIRNVLNTNPQKLVSTNQNSSEYYFLGETFETAVKQTVTDTKGGSTAGDQAAILLPLASGSAYWAENYREATPAKTGWFFNRNPNPTGDYADNTFDNRKKLFRLVSLHEGEWFHKNYVVRITDLALGNTTVADSRFSVRIVNLQGTVVEEFTDCTVNEDSANFIGKKIGDQRQEWNSDLKKYQTKGQYPNLSDYIRVEMHSDWEDGIQDNYAIPFGYYGPATPKMVCIESGSATLALNSTNPFVVSATTASVPYGHSEESNSTTVWADLRRLHQSAYLSWPSLQLTSQGTNNQRDYPEDAFFGIRQARSNDPGLSQDQVYYRKDYVDHLRALPAGLDAHTTTGPYLAPSFVFSLDNIRGNKMNSVFYHSSGSHYGAGETTITNLSGTDGLLSTFGVKQFVAPFFGGTDGVDITLTDPFSSAVVLDVGGANENNSYAYYSVKKMMDIAKEEEIVKYDVISMPGLVNDSLRFDLVNNTAKRGDALAIIDMDSGFKAKFENSGTKTLGTSTSAISDAKAQDFDTSYAATYYPPVRLAMSEGGIEVPASVAGIGVLAQSDGAEGSAPWFAPAGFNRGGIKKLGGNQGPRISKAIENLNKADRDKLYEVNINPIANFPGEGTVVFGQKTLQQTASALDRINVRRLMIYLKKRVGAVARQILFDNNVQATWNRFVASVDPILLDVKSRFGITEYKLVLDEKTTTPDLIDRNIMYAKVFVKPARAIEFIAIDFIITRTGIEF